jgi:hypothetical protein
MGGTMQPLPAEKRSDQTCYTIGGTMEGKTLTLNFARIVEDSGGAKVDELEGIVYGHDTVVEFEVTMHEAHLVEVFDAITDLAKDTVYLWAAHFARQDNTEEPLSDSKSSA